MPSHEAHGSISEPSGDNELTGTADTPEDDTPQVSSETEQRTEQFFGGSPYEKLDEFYQFLQSEPNPWHPHLATKLTKGQIIGFHWMCERHKVGGGVVADKVGLGKV